MCQQKHLKMCLWSAAISAQGNRLFQLRGFDYSPFGGPEQCFAEDKNVLSKYKKSTLAQGFSGWPCWKTEASAGKVVPLMLWSDVGTSETQPCQGILD